VALSWAVRFDMRGGQQISSLVYPLDTFSMYARIFDEKMSYLLVRDALGTVHSVEEFRAFDCDEPVIKNPAQCAEQYAIQYHLADFIRYIESHPGQGDSEAELVLRTWRVRAGKAPKQLRDCVIAHCKVSR